MVRAPCCEKMGLKKGPWTPEEDQTLIAYIQRYGHGNWRALPKQAGLLRCGKSCRLRWTNYLRPDIKRGNFSEEEEETIIKLHDMLGNRWSAIAARLPGRTDNEIKNVWHTHLKKRVKQNQANPETKMEDESDPHLRFKNPAYTPVYRQQSPSDLSTVTDSSAATSENQTTGIKDEYLDSSETFPEIDESFLLEAISVENSGWPEDSPAVPANPQVHLLPTTEPMCAYGFNLDDGMDFWYNVFIKAGDLPELPEF